MKPSSLKVGDSVLIKQNKKNSTTPPFNPRPYKVVWRKGNAVVAKRGEHKVKRNISFFKKIMPHLEMEEPELPDDDPDEQHPVGDQQPENQRPRRQPARNCQMPARFKDFVME